MSTTYDGTALSTHGKQKNSCSPLFRPHNSEQLSRPPSPNYPPRGAARLGVHAMRAQSNLRVATQGEKRAGAYPSIRPTLTLDNPNLCLQSPSAARAAAPAAAYLNTSKCPVNETPSSYNTTDCIQSILRCTSYVISRNKTPTKIPPPCPSKKTAGPGRSWHGRHPNRNRPMLR